MHAQAARDRRGRNLKLAVVGVECLHGAGESGGGINHNGRWQKAAWVPLVPWRVAAAGWGEGEGEEEEEEEEEARRKNQEGSSVAATCFFRRCLWFVVCACVHMCSCRPRRTPGLSGAWACGREGEEAAEVPLLARLCCPLCRSLSRTLSFYPRPLQRIGRPAAPPLWWSSAGHGLWSPWPHCLSAAGAGWRSPWRSMTAVSVVEGGGERRPGSAGRLQSSCREREERRQWRRDPCACTVAGGLA